MADKELLSDQEMEALLPKELQKLLPPEDIDILLENFQQDRSFKGPDQPGIVYETLGTGFTALDTEIATALRMMNNPDDLALVQSYGTLIDSEKDRKAWSILIDEIYITRRIMNAVENNPAPEILTGEELENIQSLTDLDTLMDHAMKLIKSKEPAPLPNKNLKPIVDPNDDSILNAKNLQKYHHYIEKFNLLPNSPELDSFSVDNKQLLDLCFNISEAQIKISDPAETNKNILEAINRLESQKRRIKNLPGYTEEFFKPQTPTTKEITPSNEDLDLMVQQINLIENDEQANMELGKNFELNNFVTQIFSEITRYSRSKTEENKAALIVRLKKLGLDMFEKAVIALKPYADIAETPESDSILFKNRYPQKDSLYDKAVSLLRKHKIEIEEEISTPNEILQVYLNDENGSRVGTKRTENICNQIRDNLILDDKAAAPHILDRAERQAVYENQPTEKDYKKFIDFFKIAKENKDFAALFVREEVEILIRAEERPTKNAIAHANALLEKKSDLWNAQRNGRPATSQPKTSEPAKKPPEAVKKAPHAQTDYARECANLLNVISLDPVQTRLLRGHQNVQLMLNDLEEHDNDADQGLYIKAVHSYLIAYACDALIHKPVIAPSFFGKIKSVFSSASTNNQNTGLSRKQFKEQWKDLQSQMSKEKEIFCTKSKFLERLVADLSKSVKDTTPQGVPLTQKIQNQILEFMKIVKNTPDLDRFNNLSETLNPVGEEENRLKIPASALDHEI